MCIGSALDRLHTHQATNEDEDIVSKELTKRILNDYPDLRIPVICYKTSNRLQDIARQAINKSKHDKL